jgi:hypothetical protein
MALTKLFNIRIDENLHREFKKYCEDNDLQMTDLMIGYIQSVVDGEREAKRRIEKKMSSYDPLDAIRNQYND